MNEIVGHLSYVVGVWVAIRGLAAGIDLWLTLEILTMANALSVRK